MADKGNIGIGNLGISNFGFTMMEVVIVMAIIAILAALIAPLAVQQVEQKRYDACREELKTIKYAICGDPNLIENGTRSSFGFIGDLGVLPGSLTDLVSQGLYPAWGTASNVSFGWRGPYISEYTDPWGRNYNFLTRAATVNDYTRIAVWSLGPDGVDSSQDDVLGGGDNNYGDDSMIVRITQDELFSTISGNAMDPCGASPLCTVANPTTVTIYYPYGSTPDTVAIQTNNIVLNGGISNFTSSVQVPVGIRYIASSIEYNPGTGVVTGVVAKYLFVNNGPLTVNNIRPSGPCN